MVGTRVAESSVDPAQRELSEQEMLMSAVQVQSSVIHSLDYDSVAKSLRVAFANGTGHTYQGVDEATYQAFVNAESPGKFFNQNFKTKGTR